ncbi:MAG: response regulator [Verrucomicrobiota bacterium]
MTGTAITEAPGSCLKKRILFVDDEPMILKLFEIMFERLRTEWEMDFANSGFAAVQLMTKAPYDVIVSDMRMPRMNGAELLTEVMRRHPKTARIILSGFADQEMIMKCVGVTHQYLAKPCGLELLRSTLARVCALDRWLADDKLRVVLGQLKTLPSPPALYTRILEELQSSTASMQSIGEIIAQDFGLLPKLLQLVNSAFFGISQPVTSAFEAVQLLGVETVKSLALSIHVFSCFDNAHCPDISIDSLWRHSVAMATSAKKIVELEQGDQQMAEAAFTSGLLHDVGKLLLATSLPASFREAISLAKARQIPFWQAEREIFGATHSDVGAYLFGLWGLPIAIVESVAWHHRPTQGHPLTFSALTAVHVADALENERSGSVFGGVPTSVDLEYLAELGFNDRFSVWRKVCFEPEFRSR